MPDEDPDETQTAADGEGRRPAYRPAPVDELPPGDDARYERIAEHARGGLGRIWRAQDRGLGRTVAVKELLRGAARGEARFVREALITARLEHPSIVAVHDAGRSPGGQPFYVMRLVAGRSLRERIEACAGMRERMALLPHAIAVADAVAYAHSHRVIHRDLKPSNVLVGDFGETVVVDWGLAKVLGDADLPSDAEPGPYRDRVTLELTRAGTVLGTPTYMAPEQARGDEVDERADVYALGALLYHVLAGAIPYPGADPDAVLASVLAGAPRDLAAIAPSTPPDLIAIVRKAMARRLEDRYPTARQLADDLRRFQTGQLVSAHVYRLPELLGRWIRRHRPAVIAGTLALVATAVIGVVSVRRVVQARAVAEARLTASLVDQGRRGLLAGDYPAAATYLARAYQRGASGPAIQLMLRQALRAFDRERALLQHDSRIWEVDYSARGTWLLVTTDAAAELWDGRTGEHHRSLLGHAGQVRVARFSGDERRVVTGGDDRTARVWSCDDGRQLVVLAGHDESVRDVAFSPDGRQLATATAAGTVRLWDADGTLRATIAAHAGSIWRVVYSPDGALVASAGHDGVVNLWEASTGRLVRALRGHRADVRNLAFDPAGARLVSVGYDRVAIVWDVARGAPIGRFEGHESELVHAAFSPDGRHVLTSGVDPYMQLWDASTGALVRSFRGHRGAIYWSGFDPAGERVVSVSWDGTARLWDVASGTELATLSGHAGPVVWGALRPDGSELATCSWDGTVRLWQAQGTNRRANLIAGAPSVAVRISPDRTRVLACAEDRVEVFDLATGSRSVSIPIAGPLSDCGFDPAGRTIATTEHSGSVRLWSATGGAPLRVLAEAGGAPVEALAFDATGARLAAAGIGGATSWDLRSGVATAFHPHDHASSVDFAADGTRLVTGGTDRTAKIWRLGGAEPVLERTIAAHDHAVTRARFSPDGRWIATASFDGRARVWDAASGALVADLSDHAGTVLSLAFDPSSRLVATASTDVATVWDVATASPIARFRGHVGSISDVAFASDGAMLATAGADGRVELWETGLERRSPAAVAHQVECLVGHRLDARPSGGEPAALAGCDRVVRSVPPR